jgi:hypothetical protein
MVPYTAVRCRNAGPVFYRLAEAGQHPRDATVPAGGRRCEVFRRAEAWLRLGWLCSGMAASGGGIMSEEPAPGGSSAVVRAAVGVS